MKKQAQSIEAVKAKITQAQEQLEAQLAALQTSDDWKRTLERIAILGPLSINRFSFRNILLLQAQRQELRHAATFGAWFKRGRVVKKGEKALIVLRPRIVRERSTDAKGNTCEDDKLAGFTYLSVFALDQTDGDAIPEPVRPQDFDSPEGFAWTVEALRELVRTVPGVEGIILRPRLSAADHPGCAGWFSLLTHEIVVITGESSAAQQLSVLLHEVAHAILHGDREHHATATAEVEAESTAFVCAHALGLNTSAFSLPYVATWALSGSEKEPSKAVANSGERIRKASGVILGKLFPQSSEDEAESTSVAA